MNLGKKKKKRRRRKRKKKTAHVVYLSNILKYIFKKAEKP